MKWKWPVAILVCIAVQYVGLSAVQVNEAALNVPVCLVIQWFVTLVICFSVVGWFDKIKELNYDY